MGVALTPRFSPIYPTGACPPTERGVWCVLLAKLPLTAFSSARGSTQGVSDPWLAPANKRQFRLGSSECLLLGSCGSSLLPDATRLGLATGGTKVRRLEAGLSPLVQRFLPGFRQRREKVADDAARASLDLDRHRHTRTELDELVIHLHVRTVK